MENFRKLLWKDYKVCELYLAAWNVVRQLIYELEKYSIGNTPIE
jgi:hypothetical protein